MSIKDAVPSADLLTKRYIPLSAIIVAFFMLLSTLLGPLANNKMDHAELERQGKLTVKILWGMCTNLAAVISDEDVRIAALARCVPDDQSIADNDQAYLFDGINTHRALAAAPKKKVPAGVSSGSSSSSSSLGAVIIAQPQPTASLARLNVFGPALELQ